MRDVSKLNQELVKSSEGQSSPILKSCKNRWLMNNSLLKWASTAFATFESLPVAIMPVLKSFQQIQKLLVLTNSVNTKIKSTV
jgi:hypothetical protein